MSVGEGDHAIEVRLNADQVKDVKGEHKQGSHVFAGLCVSGSSARTRLCDRV